jgi:hypothetical protein
VLEVVCKGGCGHLFISMFSHSFFSPTLRFFFIALHFKLGFSHPLVHGVSHGICSQPLDPMRIHFFRYAHGGERTISHNVMRDVFSAITKDARFHVLRANPCPFAPYIVVLHN